MKGSAYIVIFLVLIFIAGCTTPQEVVNEQNSPITPEPSPAPSPTPTPLPSPTPAPQPTPTPAPVEIPPNTVVIFYTANLGEQTNNLPIQIQEVSPYGDDLGGYGKRITWDTDYRAILAHIPSMDKTYSLHKITSPSYAESYIYSKTKDNKLIILRDWGYPEDAEIKDIIVMDPENAKILYTMNLYPTASADIAIAGSSIFYTDTIAYSYPSYSLVTGSTSKRINGGDLYKIDFGSMDSTKLLDYSDPDNSGTLYGIGDRLASVYLNPDTDEYEFREHSTSTGKILKTIYKIPRVPDLWIYGGETAFYIVIKVPNSSVLYQIHELKLTGETRLLVNIELDSSSHYIEGVDEASKHLLVSVAKGGVIDEIAVYGLEDDSFNVIPLDPDIQLLHPASEGDRFIILNPE